jgi:hypothetical protein
VRDYKIKVLVKSIIIIINNDRIEKGKQLMQYGDISLTNVKTKNIGTTGQLT